MTKIGMVILNYNDYETTNKYIKVIKDYNVLNDIVIVDNKSSDNSYEKLGYLENDKIKVIQTDANKGYAYGNNVGIDYLNKNSKDDYIIISNPDIIVDEKTIIKLKEDLDNNSDISLIAPQIEQLGEIIKGWRLPTLKDEICQNINYYHKIAKKKLLYDEKEYNKELTKVDVVSGCFFMIRRDDINKINKFDENTFLYYEENIIASKLKSINKNTYIDNSTIIKHDLSVSVDKSYNSIKKYKILKNSQKYFVKNYLKTNIFGMILLRGTYYISLIISYIVCFFRKLRRKK